MAVLKMVKVRSNLKFLHGRKGAVPHFLDERFIRQDQMKSRNHVLLFHLNNSQSADIFSRSNYRAYAKMVVGYHRGQYHQKGADL